MTAETSPSQTPIPDPTPTWGSGSAPAALLPSGTVTFLFTDIEGSTERWERQPEAMRAALERHDALLRAAVLGQGGAVFKTVGDAFCAAFGTAGAAVAAALAAQRVLGAEDWGAFGEGFAPLRVRMALHTGEAQERDGDYFGAPVNRVARLQTAAGGGQVLLSAATERLVREALPAGAWLRDHGEHRLKDLRFTEHIFQLLGEGLPERPGALRTAPPLAVENPTGLELPPGGQAILGRMFGGYARAVLTGELAGGFSGSRVYKVLPYAEADRAELPAVVKLGPAGQVGREYEAYLRHIRGRLTGIPEVWGRPVVEERGHWAGIRYGLVGAGLFDIQSLRAYAAEARAEDLVHVLESRLLVHMGALWAHNRVERRAPAAAYDALLPANLVLEPDWAARRVGSRSNAAEGGLDALDEDHATLLTPTTAMSLTLAAGDRVLLSGWVVTELEPHLGAATVDLPGSAAAVEAQEGLEARGASAGGASAGGAAGPAVTVGAYRIRLQPVPEAAGLHLGQTLAGPLPCRVRETRAGRLRREVAEAVGPGVDLSEARLRAPEAGGVGSADGAGAASGGGASSSTSGPTGAGAGAATGPLSVTGSLPNPLTALAAALGRERSLRLGTVHGDLNLENVLVDPEARTVHLIDFAQAREDLVLLDLLRLETEVITHLLPEALAEAGLSAPAAAGLMAALLREPGQDLGGGSLRKVQLMLAVLRRAAAGLLAQPDDWGEYQVGLAACLLGASKYRNLPAAGRAAAFWAAAALLGQAEAGAGTSAAALEGAVAAMLRRNPVLEAYRRGRIAEWTGPRWELDDRFVALSLLVDQGEDAAGDRWAAKGERYTSLEALLAGVDAPALVLLGPPGGGKSTILRHLELSLSLKGLDDPTVPYTFFIQLNQYQPARPGEALPAPGDWLAQRWAARNPALPPLDELLAEGRMLLLLDALNEMPAAGGAAGQARLVRLWKDWLVQLAAERPGSRVVFSCRTLDYSAPLSTAALRVPQVNVEGLDDDGVRRFLDSYTPEHAAEIWEAIAGTQQLELLRAPFFLKLLVDQVEGTGELAEGRAALFTGFVRQALRREVERGGMIAEPGELLTERDLRRVAQWQWKDAYELPERGLLFPKLAALAYGMQDAAEAGGEAQVRIDVDRALALLDTPSDEDIVKAGEALAVLDEDQAADALMYVHQLVQEYFAARILARAPRPELVAAPWKAVDISPTVPELLATLPQSETLPPLRQTGWEETTLLAAAMADDAEGFVRGLMTTNLALAGRAAALPDLHGRLGQALLDDLRWALVGRSRDREADLRARIAAGYAVGELGDPRFERRVGPYGEYLVPPMVEVPGGVYPIGDDEPITFHGRGRIGTTSAHVPRHTVAVAAFRIAQFPVTNAEYACFMAAGGYDVARWWQTEDALRWLSGEIDNEGAKIANRYWRRRFQTEEGLFVQVEAERGFLTDEERDRWKRWVSLDDIAFEEELAERWKGAVQKEPAFWREERMNQPSQPVVGVCWYEARAYAAWLCAQSGEDWRLPTEVEWEAAARGLVGRAYAWGDDIGSALGNTVAARLFRASPVGVFVEGDTPDGLSDVTGNVSEWSASVFGEIEGPDDSVPDYAYPYRSDDGREDVGAPASAARVTRGGSWNSALHLTRSATRNYSRPANRNFPLGFRMAASCQ